MKVDDTAALSEVLRGYQENQANDHIEARLAIALTRVVENSVRPSLQKKLRPQDVDDVCSEIILGFWKFRLSVRPNESDKLIQTLKHRRMTDQVRAYYREDERRTHKLAADERELLALLPSHDGKPGSEAEQDVWEWLYSLKLSAKDHLAAFMLYLGIDKQVIGKLLGMSNNAVTRSIKRCREVLEGVNREVDAKELDRLGGQPDRYEQLRQLLNDPGKRQEYIDDAEELLQRESARYSTAMLDRAGFYAELVSRESKRLKGKEQLDALTIIKKHFPRVVEAIDYVMSIDDSECLAKFARNIAAPLLMQGKFDLGASVFNRLLSQAEKTGNRLLEIRTGSAYGQFLIKTGRLDKAYEVSLHALELAQLEGNESALAGVLNVLGNVTRYLGRFEEATAFYEQQLELDRKLHLKSHMGFALCNLGILAGRQRRLDDARRLFTESLEIARESGNTHRIAGELHNLACVSAYQGDHPEAQKLLQEALELNRIIGNRSFEACNLGELGRAAIEQGRFIEARRLYASAQLIGVEIGNELLYADCECGLGTVAAAMESYEDARRHFEKSAQLIRRIGAKVELAACLEHLGALHCDLGDYEAAVPLLSEALTISMHLGDTHCSSLASTSLALVALETGKLPEATKYLARALNMSAEAGMPRGTLITLQAGVQLLANADKASPAALLAYGITPHLKRLGLVFGRKWHRDLDEAIASCSAMLEADQRSQLEQQAASMSIEDLTTYALEALGNLQAELNTPKA